MRTLFLVCSVLVGCADSDPDGLPDDSEGVPYIGEDEMQGRWLLGQSIDQMKPNGATTFLSVGRASILPNDPRVVEVTDNGALIAKIGANAASFTNIQLSSSTGQVVRIAPGGLEGSHEVLTVDVPNGSGGWKSICKDNGKAFPMRGVWTSTGFHRDDPTQISFGCADGVAYKCGAKWGYVPGVSPDLTIAYDPAAIEWNTHLACTRMASADICGDRTPHTREMTPIIIRDRIPGHRPDIDGREAPNPVVIKPPLARIAGVAMPPPPDTYFFESMWSSKEHVGAVCLEKQRWASLPSDTNCGALVDPRTHPATPPPRGAKYCEELLLDNDEMLRLRPLIANASMTYDIIMRRWQHPGTKDIVTTARGYVDTEEGKTEYPFPGLGYTVPLGEDGILLRNLPGSLIDSSDPTKTDVVKVYSKGTTDRTLMADPLLDRSSPSFEGYLLTRPASNRSPFYRWIRKDPTTHVLLDEVTSVNAGAGFTSGALQGYVYKNAATE